MLLSFSYMQRMMTQTGKILRMRVTNTLMSILKGRERLGTTSVREDQSFTSINQCCRSVSLAIHVLYSVTISPVTDEPSCSILLLSPSLHSRCCVHTHRWWKMTHPPKPVVVEKEVVIKAHTTARPNPLPPVPTVLVKHTIPEWAGLESDTPTMVAHLPHHQVCIYSLSVTLYKYFDQA